MRRNIGVLGILFFICAGNLLWCHPRFGGFWDSLLTTSYLFENGGFSLDIPLRWRIYWGISSLGIDEK
jgi:hypothetical protein